MMMMIIIQSIVCNVVGKWSMLWLVWQECISQSALVTKFAHHVANAGVIVSEVVKLWTEMHRISQTLRFTLLLTYFSRLLDGIALVLSCFAKCVIVDLQQTSFH